MDTKTQRCSETNSVTQSNMWAEPGFESRSAFYSHTLSKFIWNLILLFLHPLRQVLENVFCNGLDNYFRLWEACSPYHNYLVLSLEYNKSHSQQKMNGCNLTLVKEIALGTDLAHKL